LAPDDLTRMSGFFGLGTAELFRRYLVLDYALLRGRKEYYVCPARSIDEPGKPVDWAWTFSSSPCVFLREHQCTIEQVKPYGGRTFFCRKIAPRDHEQVKFGKREAARAWKKSLMLKELLNSTFSPAA